MNHANIVVKSPSNDMLQNKSFTGEITENFVHQSPRGNMHKLFDYIRTALKRFLACLTFHRKEIEDEPWIRPWVQLYNVL